MQGKSLNFQPLETISFFTNGDSRQSNSVMEYWTLADEEIAQGELKSETIGFTVSGEVNSLGVDADQHTFWRTGVVEIRFVSCSSG
jgi:hypothetical protein